MTETTDAPRTPARLNEKKVIERFERSSLHN